MKSLACFNGRFTAVVCPCSRACLPSPVQPCPASWEALGVDFGGVSFPGPVPWLSTAMMLLWRGTLGYLTAACRGGGEEWPRVLLRAQSLTWCLRLPCVLEGREMASSCTQPSCPASGWWEMLMTGKPWQPFMYMLLVWVLHCCCIAEVLSLVSMLVGTAVVDLCVCWLGHLALPLYFVFCTAGSLFCVLLRGCSEEDESRNVIARKKISLYDRIQITFMVKCFSVIHVWNSFFSALCLPRIPCSELWCGFVTGKLCKDSSL